MASKVNLITHVLRNINQKPSSQEPTYLLNANSESKTYRKLEQPKQPGHMVGWLPSVNHCRLKLTVTLLGTVMKPGLEK
jgi:hypothetical protein